MMTLCILTLVAVAQIPNNNLPSATVKEKLSDGSYIVVIEGGAYKAISAADVRGILKTKEDLDKAVRARVELEKQIAFYEANKFDFKEVIRVANEQRDEEVGLKLNFKTLYEDEKKLRLDAEKLHGSPGKVDKLLSNPVVQVATKIVVPIVQTWVSTLSRDRTIVMPYDQLALLQSQQRSRPMLVRLQ